ncbi:MAG: hypothetical protein H7Y15_01490 [Pseudonocardia sp.]|nr:hypothetical protein [Pseudonocardia sp.]
MIEVPDLREFVRDELVPEGATLLIRGGPDTVEKIASHAARTARAYLLDGEPAHGVSMFAALDDIGSASMDGLLGGRLSTYRVVHRVEAGLVRDRGFALLPTFGRPHVTLVLTPDRIDELTELLGPAQVNPMYGVTTRRARRRS